METLDNLRQSVKHCMNLNQYGTACYWADKLVSLGQNEPGDVYLYAKALFHHKHYYRAIMLLTRYKELMNSLVCRYLAAQAYYACGELEEALAMLGESDKSIVFPASGAGMVNKSTCLSGMILPRPQGADTPSLVRVGSLKSEKVSSFTPLEEQLFDDSFCTPRALKSSVSLLKGKIFELLENRQIASQHYREALLQDVTCYEAFEKLVHFQAINPDEEVSFLTDLDFAGQLDPQTAKLTEFLYKDKILKHCKVENEIPAEFVVLKQNVDVVVNKAERLLDICHFHSCHAITSKVMQADPYNPACLPIHVSVLKELNKSNELFNLSHRLMAIYPSSAISWFTVGCYYLCTHRNEIARRHFLKACQLDRRFGPAWLALGHAFAADGEHDQAIASYCTAAQVIHGSHIPIMYIGIEYSASNNRNLTERFLRQAYQMSRTDPFVLHELATLAFQARKYTEALDLFTRAFDEACKLGGQVPSTFWEPLVNNMAHTCRKLGAYARAIEMHQLALRLLPDCTSTFASLALVHAMTGQVNEAIDHLHRALSLQSTGVGDNPLVANGGSNGNSSSSFAAIMLTLCVDLLTSRENRNKRTRCPGKDITDSPPEKHLPRVNVPGTMLGSHKVRFRKRSADNSANSKSSGNNALHLDVLYQQTGPTDTTSRLLDSSDDEDVTMELG